MKTKPSQVLQEELTASCEASWNSEKLLILGIRQCGSASVGEGRPGEVLGPSRRALQPLLTSWIILMGLLFGTSVRRISRALEIQTQVQRGLVPLLCSG